MSTSIDPGCFPIEQTAFPGPYHKSSALPLGPWKVMANGRIYTLNIRSVSGHEVNAEFSSGDIANARWDKDAGNSGVLTFTRVLSDPPLEQNFTGYLLRYDTTDPKWRMAGTFGNKELGHPESGWYATLERKDRSTGGFSNVTEATMSLQTIIRQEALAALVGELEDPARSFWDLKYLYLYGLSEIGVPVRTPSGPPDDLSTVSVEERLLVHEKLIMGLIDIAAGDPTPQPSLQAILQDREARLAAASGLAEQLDSKLDQVKEEIKRLGAAKMSQRKHK